MNKYLTDFLNLKCAGDVINVVSPVTRFEKEISEAMAIVKQVKRIVFANPDTKYTIIDMCAGNALASVIIAHLLPVKEIIAIDKKGRKRQWDRVRGFVYNIADIFKFPLLMNTTSFFRTPTIIISSHPCQMAHAIVAIYNSNPYYKHLILMPCCHGKHRNKIPSGIASKLGKYLAWTYDLALSSKGDFIVDKNVISPCNAIVVANKGGDKTVTDL